MIKLLVLDVDGTLTNGQIIYSSDGMESKSFNVKDGLGIASWIKMGHQVAIITGRSSTIVQRRAEELGIEQLFQGVKDKKSLLLELLESLSIELSEVAAIGDDLNDYKMLKIVGRSFAPFDGVKEIRSCVETVLSAKGGEGAVREMIDIVVEENKEQELFLSSWIEGA